MILAMQADPGFASRALAAGASAFVLKEAADGELEHAIRAAATGETYVSPRTEAAPP